MDLFIVKERLKMMLWFVAVGIFGGVLSTWYAWGQIGFGGEGLKPFLLSATVTGALALAWVAMLVLVFSFQRIMDPRSNQVDRLGRIPWWILKILALCLFIGVMVVVLQKHSGEGMNVFSLLRSGELAQLEERIIAAPELLENKDKKSGLTLLEMALERGNVDAVDLLLSNGAELETLGAGLNLVLTSLKSPSMLGTLLRHGADPGMVDANGMAPLHYAVETHNTNALVMLLEADADVSVRNSLYQTPLLMAVGVDQLSMVGILLEHGADPNQWDKRGDTTLHKAVRRKSPEALRFLLEQGGDPKIFNFSKLSPLHLAALNGQDELVELFLEDPEIVHLLSEDDRTPFDQALRGRHYETARLLLRHGADIDRVRNGFTATHLMVIAKDYETAGFLIEEGADVYIADSEGETAFDLIRRKQLQGLLDLIEARDHPTAESNTVESIISP